MEVSGDFREKHWFLTLRKGQMLGMFESGVLRKIFGPNMDEITGKWIRLHNLELYEMHPRHILLGSSNHKNEKGWACGTHGGQETDIQGFGGETWGKKISLGRPMYIWANNIKMDLQDVG